MRSVKERRATLADLAIGVAACAIGMASLKFTFSSFSIGWFRSMRGASGAFELYYEMVLSHGVPLLAVASLGVVVLTSRQPRPPLRRLARRPGFVLSLSNGVAALGTACVLGAYHFRRGDPFPISFVNVVAHGVVFNVGWAALGTWLALALAGHCGPWPSRLDRLGYGLALIWAMLFLAGCVHFVV